MLHITTGAKPYSKHWKPSTTTWSEFCQSMDRPGSEKECGGFVFGQLRETTVRHPGAKKDCTRVHRRKVAVVSRSALTLDADHAGPGFLTHVGEALPGLAWATYTTWSHTPEDPRHRLVIPLDRDITPDEHRLLARYVMDVVPVPPKGWDRTSDQPERQMYRPSDAGNGFYSSHVQPGDPLPADEWLEKALDAVLRDSDGAPSPKPNTEPARPASREQLDDVAARVVARLEAMQDWPEGHAEPLPSDAGKEGGWDLHTFGVACELVRAGNSGLGLSEAEELFREHCPTDDEFGLERVGHKWESALDAVGDGGLAVWETAADVFTALPPLAEDDVQKVDSTGGWTPVDWDDDAPPPTTELWRRTDGVGLLYPGMTHSIHGESESGKSMLAQAEVAVLLKQGQRVLYLDYEAEKGSVGERLNLMGVTREQRKRWLDYVKPERDYAATPGSRAAFEALMERDYALVVIDGVTEALTQAPPRQRSMAGLGGNDDIAFWDDRMPKLLARRTGAAVVMIDHVAKNSETAGRFAIGGQAKMANISGAAYLVKPVRPLGRGLVGVVEIHIAKDRHGFLRGHGGSYSKDNRLQLVAIATVDGRDGLDVSLDPPPVTPEGRSPYLEEVMGRVADFLARLDELVPDDTTANKRTRELGASRSLIATMVVGKTDAIRQALDELVDDGCVVAKPDGQAVRYKLVAPYHPDFGRDQGSEQ